MSTANLTALQFHRLLVKAADDSVLVDLVAEPIEACEPPTYFSLNGMAIRHDTRRELLAAKLCALLGRAELRDLWDTSVVLDLGEDLSVGCEDAKRKDGEFSALTLAWILETSNVSREARGAGMPAGDAEALTAFLARLRGNLLTLARPE